MCQPLNANNFSPLNANTNATIGQILENRPFRNHLNNIGWVNRIHRVEYQYGQGEDRILCSIASNDHRIVINMYCIGDDYFHVRKTENNQIQYCVCDQQDELLNCFNQFPLE
jgi:hypothetical protein